MGKLVVTEFMTLDGVFEDPGGQYASFGGWAFKFDRGDDGTQFKIDELMSSDVQLLGRTTYEGFAAAWPSMNDDQFGAKMNGMPKVVFSSTLENPTWNNTTVASGNLAETVASLKQQYDGNILVQGSGRLVRDLLAQGLVDELRLMIYPIVVGTGGRLFDGLDQVPLEVVDTRKSSDVVLLTLRRAAA